MFYIYSRSQFERETMLSAEGLSLPALWWARVLYLERCCEGKSLLFSSSWLFTPAGHGRCSSWLASRDGFGYVHTAGSSGFVGLEIPSAWAFIFLLLLTTVQACSRACSVGYPGFLGHTIQSGSIIHVAVSVSLLAFVLTGLKLTLGCLTAIPLPPRTSLRCISHVTMETTATPIQMGGVTWFHTSVASQCFPELDELLMLIMLSCSWIW